MPIKFNDTRIDMLVEHMFGVFFLPVVIRPQRVGLPMQMGYLQNCTISSRDCTYNLGLYILEQCDMSSYYLIFKNYSWKSVRKQTNVGPIDGNNIQHCEKYTEYINQMLIPSLWFKDICQCTRYYDLTFTNKNIEQYLFRPKNCH